MPEACNGKQNGLVKVQYAKLANISWIYVIYMSLHVYIWPCVDLHF